MDKQLPTKVCGSRLKFSCKFHRYLGDTISYLSCRDYKATLKITLFLIIFHCSCRSKSISFPRRLPSYISAVDHISLRWFFAYLCYLHKNACTIFLDLLCALTPFCEFQMIFLVVNSKILAFILTILKTDKNCHRLESLRRDYTVVISSTISPLPFPYCRNVLFQIPSYDAFKATDVKVRV